MITPADRKRSTKKSVKPVKPVEPEKEENVGTPRTHTHNLSVIIIPDDYDIKKYKKTYGYLPDLSCNDTVAINQIGDSNTHIVWKASEIFSKDFFDFVDTIERTVGHLQIAIECDIAVRILFMEFSGFLEEVMRSSCATIEKILRIKKVLGR